MLFKNIYTTSFSLSFVVTVRVSVKEILCHLVDSVGDYTFKEKDYWKD